MKELQENQKIFGLGLYKTGTTSLSKALDLLGIRTIHNPSDARTYSEISKGNYRLSILNVYQAIIDIPVVPYYTQFDKTYPCSKFILTVREQNSWIQSIENHWKLMSLWEEDKFKIFLHECVYGSINFNKNRFLHVYNKHLKNVHHYFRFRPNDLLVIDIINGDGWEVLCPFLGLTVPEIPFPYLNTAEDTKIWSDRLHQTLEEIDATIPRQSPFILVDQEEFGVLYPASRGVIPFLERAGKYWGPPADDETGIQELERLRNAGAHFIAFAWPAFWWLEYYVKLHDYLRLQFCCVLQNERLVIFDLR